MRKIIAISLVAILAVGSVFAAFSGSASVGFGGNLDNGNFGFIDQSTNVKFDVDLATADAEAVAEGDVYASVKATFVFKTLNGELGDAAGDLYEGIGRTSIIADITEAKIAGENWYVSILGVPGAPNYAQSAIDTYTVEDGYDKYGLPRDDFDKNYNYGIGYSKTSGVEFGVADYKFGFGLLGDYTAVDSWKLKNNLKTALYAETPEYDFDGVKVQAGAVYSYSGFGKLTDGEVDNADFKGASNAMGVSAKVGFENETLSATVATDMGFDFTKKEAKDVFNTDIAANFKYDFVTVDAYYATKAVAGEKPVFDGKTLPEGAAFTDTTKSYQTHVLSAQVKTDLNSFDVPVALTVAVKDIIAKQNISLKAEVTAIEDLKITAKAGYIIDADGRDTAGDVITEKHDVVGKWSAGADVEYTADIFTAKAGISVEQKLDAAKDVILGASASVSTKALIPGAELKLAWADAKDLLDKAADKTNYGKITASVKVEF